MEAPTSPLCPKPAPSAQSRGNFPSGENPVPTISGPTPEIFPLVRGVLSQGRSPSRIWNEVSKTRVRIQGMRSMRDQGIGHNMDEAFVKRFRQQARSHKSQGKEEKKILKLLMDAKAKDQKRYLRRLRDEMNVARNELKDRFGSKSMKFKRSITKLNKLGRETEGRDAARTEEKINHLKKKHAAARGEREREMRVYKTKWKERFQGVHIYQKKKILRNSDCCWRRLIKNTKTRKSW